MFLEEKARMKRKASIITTDESETFFKEEVFILFIPPELFRWL